MFTTTDTSYTVVTDLQYTYTFSSTGDKQIRTEKSTLMLTCLIMSQKRS